MADSDVASGQYVIKAAPPSLSVAGGTYNTAQTVALSAGAGLSIYYTTNGSVPTASSTRYTGPIAVGQSMTLRAIAGGTGVLESDVASASYVFQAAAPTFDPPSRSFVLPLSVSLSTTTPGARIFYTTDGSTPTLSSRQYTGPILVVTTTTIKAMAVRLGWNESGVSTATYTLLGL
jgi:N-acetyl-beta-hexosaminidase